jgi:hypothetical protein
MFRRLALLAVVAGIAGLVVRQIAPEVARYLKIREM